MVDSLFTVPIPPTMTSIENHTFGHHASIVEISIKNNKTMTSMEKQKRNNNPDDYQKTQNRNSRTPQPKGPDFILHDDLEGFLENTTATS